VLVLRRAPGAVVHSCGHRRLRPSETTSRVRTHPCDKCEITEHTRLILDALDDSAAAAVRILDDSPLYALFCGTAADTVEWWDEIFPLVEAYFVRMVSVYVAIATVEHRPTTSYSTSTVLASTAAGDTVRASTATGPVEAVPQVTEVEKCRPLGVVSRYAYRRQRPLRPGCFRRATCP
jgi:hypothetical protein